jgi:hypothetical protein
MRFACDDSPSRARRAHGRSTRSKATGGKGASVRRTPAARLLRWLHGARTRERVMRRAVRSTVARAEIERLASSLWLQRPAA